MEKYRPWIRHDAAEVELNKPLCYFHQHIHFVALLPKDANVPYFDTTNFADINTLFVNAPDYELPYVPVVQPGVIVID